jgi:capsular polysaccharide biosynthesis protein
VPITVKAAAASLVVSMAIGAIAYGVGKWLPKTYQSSGLIRVALASQQGINEPVVTAANDTASQYAQLASSQPVMALTAKTLGVPAHSLKGKISGSTVNAQNLVQVTVTGVSAQVAMARAAAASASLQRYITTLNAQQSAQYQARVHGALSQVNRTADSLIRRLAKDPPTQRSTDTRLAESLSTQRDQLLGQVARDAASNQPTLQVVDSATAATVSSPKPTLYAVVAFVVALVITGRAAFVLSGRKRD